MCFTRLPLFTINFVMLPTFVQTGVVENLAQPVRFLDAFIKPKRVAVQGGSGGAMQGGSGGAIQGGSGAVTLVDVCRAGAVDSINIKHVVHKS